MSLLPEFSLSTVVQPDKLKHDKITLWVDDRVVYQCTIDEAQLFKMALGQGRIFTRPGINPRSWISVRRAPRRNNPPPLFSGDYRLNFDSAHPPETMQLVHAQLRLELNLNRFLHHQNASAYIPPRRDFSTTTAEFFETGVVHHTDEFALDNSDNWIPDLPGFENLSHPGFSDRIIRDYIEGVLREIDADIGQAADTASVLVHEDQPRLRYNVRYVETYREFAVPGTSSPRIVSHLEPLLQSYNELGFTAKDYRLAGQQPWNGNSRVLILKIRNGVLLRIYSKTNNRLRLEIVHDLTESFLPQLPGELAADARKHTSATLDGVYRILRRARADAAEILNSVLQHMRNRGVLPATPKTHVDFLSDIIDAIGNGPHTQLIISMLIAKGGITSTPSLRAKLKKLKRAGVLRVQPRNRRREYVIVEQYQSPVAMLRAFPLLTARRRTRASAVAA